MIGDTREPLRSRPPVRAPSAANPEPDRPGGASGRVAAPGCGECGDSPPDGRRTGSRNRGATRSGSGGSRTGHPEEPRDIRGAPPTASPIRSPATVGEEDIRIGSMAGVRFRFQWFNGDAGELFVPTTGSCCLRCEPGTPFGGASLPGDCSRRVRRVRRPVALHGGLRPFGIEDRPDADRETRSGVMETFRDPQGSLGRPRPAILASLREREGKVGGTPARDIALSRSDR